MKNIKDYLDGEIISSSDILEYYKTKCTQCMGIGKRIIKTCISLCDGCDGNGYLLKYRRKKSSDENIK